MKYKHHKIIDEIIEAYGTNKFYSNELKEKFNNPKNWRTDSKKQNYVPNIYQKQIIKLNLRTPTGRNTKKASQAILNMNLIPAYDKEIESTSTN